MKPCGGSLTPLREHCSRIHVCSSNWMLPQMTCHLCLLILSSLAVSSQLGLEDVFFGPQDQTVREGEGVFFQCVSGDSSPPASITWLKDGRQIRQGRQIQGAYGGGNQQKTSGTLHLFNVTLEDDGLYTCVTHNPLLNISKRSNPAKLTVQGVPGRLQITQGPDNITVAMGTEVSMNCAVRGFPVPMVHWFKDGCLLRNCSASFSLRNNGQLLILRNVTKEVEGWYHCVASNQEESVTSPSALLLLAEMDWNFIQQPKNLTARKGENVTVTCRPPYSRPEAQVSWFKNNQLLTPSAHVDVLPSGDLFFLSVQEHNSGTYFCRASNIHLHRFLTSRRATLTVLAPPSVKLWPQVLTVPVGARVVLDCQVTGYPPPSISWVKKGHSRNTGGRIAVGGRNATLSIQSARSYDEGVYVCEASNTLGQSQNTAMLRVAVSPIIVTFVGQVSCRIGDAVVLPCRAVGILPITYSWTRGRAESQSPISTTENRHVAEDGALHISSVQHQDTGEYVCTAGNRAGQHQRRTILTVTAEHRPAARGRQTRLVLSARSNTSKGQTQSQTSEALAEELLDVHVEAKNGKNKCSSSECDARTNRATNSTSTMGSVAELNLQSGLLGHLSQQHLNWPRDNLTQLLVTQMPPMLPPPPHPHFQSMDHHSQSSETGEPSSQTSVATTEELGTTSQYLLTEGQSPSMSGLPHSKFQAKVSDMLSIESVSHGAEVTPVRLPASESLTVISASQPQSGLEVSSKPFGFLKPDSYSSSPKLSHVTQIKKKYSETTSPAPSPVEMYLTEPQVFTESQVYQRYHTPASTDIPQTEAEDATQPLRQETQSDPDQSFTQILSQWFHLELSTQPFTHHPQTAVVKSPKTQSHSQPSSMIPSPTSTTSTSQQTRPQSSPTQHPLLSAQDPLPQTETQPNQHRNPPKTQAPVSAVQPTDQTSDASTFHTKIPVVNMSGQAQADTSPGDKVQSDKAANDTELTEWLKRNTSQSPMTSNDPRETQQAPSWLPVLEKHDIPIVVGVGVSLAFIFITVTFYSVVQNNDPAPTNRAAQRNLGVPVRHAERRAAGRTYENRAFEDDDCVAVIEQSPNTSDTRARPPGPSLVTVQMKPTFEDLQEDTPPSPDSHSVTVETYPEPILDTKIDSSLDEEKGFSLSQPSIQLQCAEDWTSDRSPCHDALPPPLSLPSRSPSPSPPSRLEEGLRSSLTLQSTEARVAPIHHSLSISHGSPPLLLSHHVSLGMTTVAVDVHFYPAASASAAVGTSTHINSLSNSTSVTAPLFSPPLVNQENDQSAGRFHHSK